MLNKIGALLIPLLISTAIAQVNVLDQYILEGLENNLALIQQEFSYQKSVRALDEARGLFFPSVNILARYTRADGGREIVVPVNSFVSPIYDSLNDLFENLGLPPADFPTLPDQTIPFLREKEHESKMRLVQPLFQLGIYHNYHLRKDLSEMQSLATAIYKRDLIRNIKQAYFNYAQALYAVDIFKQTREVLAENLRVSERLYAAQKVTRDAVYRAEAELSAVEQQQLGVQNRLQQSCSYFNFLLNRPLDSEIIFDESTLELPIRDFTFEEATRFALAHREELVQLRTGIEAAGESRSISKSAYFPGVNAVVDYGFQGEEYRFDKDHDFWTASVVLEWNIFNGLQDKARVAQATLEQRRLETQLTELNKQIELEIRQTYDNFKIAQKKIEVAEKQLVSARASFELIQKKYQQGAANLIEFLDARSNFTGAEISRLIAYYDYYASYAQLERSTAYYNLAE